MFLFMSSKTEQACWSFLFLVHLIRSDKVVKTWEWPTSSSFYEKDKTKPNNNKTTITATYFPVEKKLRGFLGYSQ